MIKLHLMLGALWFIYCFFHSFFAHEKVKTFVQRTFRVGASTYRIGYNIFALGTLVGVLYVHIITASKQIFTPTPFSMIMAGLFAVTGMVVMLICISKYFKQLSGLFKESQQSTLQTGGLHQWVRHPLYIGTFIFLIGLVLAWPSYANALAVFIIIVYTVAGTVLEEKKLVQEYGEEYLLYQQRVPMLLPRLSGRN